MKPQICIFLSFALFVLTTGCKKNEPTTDPAARFTEAYADYSLEAWIDRELVDSNNYYTYFCICNASDHKVYALLDFGTLDYVANEIDPGYKAHGRIHTEKFGVDGVGVELISSFNPFLESIQVYYDDAGNRVYHPLPGIIGEEYIDVDFSKRYKSKQVRDQSQWIYEEFTPNRARWTYIFTNADYERAKKISEERDKNNPEAM